MHFAGHSGMLIITMIINHIYDYRYIVIMAEHNLCNNNDYNNNNNNNNNNNSK